MRVRIAPHASRTCAEVNPDGRRRRIYGSSNDDARAVGPLRPGPSEVRIRHCQSIELDSQFELRASSFAVGAPAIDLSAGFGSNYTSIDWRCQIPVYEFQCQDCGKKFEIVATLAEKAAGLDPACPKCGRRRARQVFSRFTLLAGSKTESDDFDDGLDETGPESGGAGLPDDTGMDDLDDLGSDYSGDLDDIE